MSVRPKPMLLIILDGFGYSENKEFNAIDAANTPHWDQLWQQCPHQLISGSGLDVGLPDGQMGNSEVGHLNLGAGRVVYQDFTRIAKDITEGKFEQNPVLLKAVQSAVAADKAVHIMGLLSPGGVHSHEDQIFAMIKMAADKGADKIYLHAFLDGRDTPPKSAAQSIDKAEQLFKRLGKGRIASLCGRYYAMDRDNRWDRIELAYDMLTLDKAEASAHSASEALQNSYAAGITDEFVKPVVICNKGQSPAIVSDDDAVIFMNFRADRARELTRAFTEQDFKGFHRQVLPRCHFVCLTEFAADICAEVAYKPLKLKNTLGEYISQLGLKQLRIAETEKYAHVTFFFNGGVEQPFPGESRDLIPSPKVATYDLQPEMNAPLLTDHLVDAIVTQQYDLIICNYANADMVGHTGNFDAAVKAIETLDDCIGRVTHALKRVGGEALITADHGNAEKMKDLKSGQPFTAHTSDPVPLVYVGRKAKVVDDTQDKMGTLSDIAPTLLYLMDLKIPQEMTGHPLFQLSAS